jgi:hypothetical protein
MFHFTSKSYLIYAQRNITYGCEVEAIAVFNTEKRAIAFMEKLKAKQIKDGWDNAKFGVQTLETNPDKLVKGIIIGGCKE